MATSPKRLDDETRCLRHEIPRSVAGNRTQQPAYMSCPNLKSSATFQDDYERYECLTCGLYFKIYDDDIK